jgi:NADH-quinone oxidoreductase subunit J
MKAVGEDFGTVKAVGRVLFTQYLLPFEATSVLLLVAIVGAVVVAKEKI